MLMSVVFLNLHANAQTNRSLVQAAENLRLLMIDPVKSKLDMLLTDALNYGHSGGHIDNKQEFIEKLTSGKSHFVSIDITDQTVQVYKHTGIIRHNLYAVTNDGGKSGTVKLHVLTVWIKKGHKWMLASRQGVKIV